MNAVFRDRAPAWERAGIFAVDVVSLPLERSERARWLISIDLARGGVVRRTLRVELWEDAAVAVGDDLTGQGSPLMNEARSFRGDEVTELAHRAADWIEGELSA